MRYSLLIIKVFANIAMLYMVKLLLYKRLILSEIVAKVDNWKYYSNVLPFASNK